MSPYASFGRPKANLPRPGRQCLATGECCFEPDYNDSCQMELIPPETSLQKWSEVFYLRCLRAFGRFRAICPWTVGKRRKSIKMPTGEESVEANQQKPAICPQAPVWMNHICLHLEVRVLRTNSGYCTVPDGKADGMAGSAALVLKDHHLVCTHWNRVWSRAVAIGASYR